MKNTVQIKWLGRQITATIMHEDATHFVLQATLVPGRPLRFDIPKNSKDIVR